MDCANIARNIFFLPEEFRAQPLELITSNLSGHSKLSFEWFRALSAHSLDKSLFFPHFLSLLRSLPANEQQLLLDQLNQDEFYGFYIYFLDNQNREEKFNFLSEYLKHKEKHSYFEYLLLLTPQVHQKILDTVLPVLEPVHLIELIAKLIEKSQQDSSYLAPLHQLLMQLCLRMQTTLEENAAIHQWTKYPAIAEYLFSTPRCLHSLCSRSSLLQNITPSMLQGMLITAIESDLRLRAVRVLNTIEYRPDEMDEKALRLLHFHKGQPAVLQQIFKSLYKVENSLDDRGKKILTP